MKIILVIEIKTIIYHQVTIFIIKFNNYFDFHENLNYTCVIFQIHFDIFHKFVDFKHINTGVEIQNSGQL